MKKDRKNKKNIFPIAEKEFCIIIGRIWRHIQDGSMKTWRHQMLYQKREPYGKGALILGRHYR